MITLGHPFGKKAAPNFSPYPILPYGLRESACLLLLKEKMRVEVLSAFS